jgi:DNA-binding Lrp family transcriptional regulator
MSISELSKQVDASRPTVIKTLKAMTDEGLILLSAGINAHINDYKIATLGIYVATPEERANVIEILKQCPKVLNIFRMNDQANLLLELCGPDEQSLISTVNCIGDLEQIEIKYSRSLGVPLKNMSIPIEVGDNTNTPCGKNCTECVNNHNSWCNGCYTFSKN